MRRSRARAARVWDLGPIPIRAYALCIIAGIIAAIWIGERRWVARGGKRGTVSDIAVWAVIFGLVGGRLYHVITDNELYFRAGRDPWRAFYVWEGGLGIWGAIALGGVGAWIGCRRRGIKLPPFADAAAPGIAVAQGIGRWGNYFNQELFGRPTDLPWAVRIDPDRPSTVPGATGYHPTFLYECCGTSALAGVLIYVDRRFKMGRGRVFALYVMGYTAGRVWIEMLRIDTRQPHPRPAAERVDLDPRLRRRAGLLPAPPGTAGDRRRAGAGPGHRHRRRGAAATPAGEKSAADPATATRRTAADEATPADARTPPATTDAEADAERRGRPQAEARAARTTPGRRPARRPTPTEPADARRRGAAEPRPSTRRAPDGRRARPTPDADRGRPDGAGREPGGRRRPTARRARRHARPARRRPRPPARAETAEPRRTPAATDPAERGAETGRRDARDGRDAPETAPSRRGDRPRRAETRLRRRLGGLRPRTRRTRRTGGLAAAAEDGGAGRPAEAVAQPRPNLRTQSLQRAYIRICVGTRPERSAPADSRGASPPYQRDAASNRTASGPVPTDLG